MIYDETDSALADMCFTKITITHSVYYLDHIDIFEDLFEQNPDYRKIALLMLLINIDVDILRDASVVLKNI